MSTVTADGWVWSDGEHDVLATIGFCSALVCGPTPQEYLWWPGIVGEPWDDAGSFVPNTTATIDGGHIIVKADGFACVLDGAARHL
ncbi:hypothetical protein [Planomonospora parontospora]|uniref:hypothetical protein n=1 Tax=Planomonospora parontospora TaxID=58119 RepID=UPI00166FF050|nr:hypothetical protein [Planomonospora parontospora]